MINDSLKIPRTAYDVWQLLPFGTLAELHNNTIYMSPAPDFLHQSISAHLFRQISNYVVKKSLGNVLFSPVDVELDKKNVFQPDIIFISNSNLKKIVKDNKIIGAPDLVIEILSPGKENRKRDLEDKLKAYEKFAVKEYVVVDPQTKEIHQFILQGKKYHAQPAMKLKFQSAILKKRFTIYNDKRLIFGK
jgi:Uma2 family endonuclease